MKNRILKHVTIKASELKPHPLNWRIHTAKQRKALKNCVDKFGFARSVTAYEDPEWGLTIIDGHARVEELQDKEVTVEVLDVTRDEAQGLLLSLDPLAAMAKTDADVLALLIADTPVPPDDLAKVWDDLLPSAPTENTISDTIQYYVIITCESEAMQAKVLEQCQKKKWDAKPSSG